MRGGRGGFQSVALRVRPVRFPRRQAGLRVLDPVRSLSCRKNFDNSYFVKKLQIKQENASKIRFKNENIVEFSYICVYLLSFYDLLLSYVLKIKENLFTIYKNIDTLVCFTMFVDISVTDYV